MAPLISIIIPAYDSERFIRQCLESVLAQTYQDWEIIVIEDGTKDQTESIVNDVAAKALGKVSYLRSPVNIGPGAARNLGIKASRGEYIAFLDSDDLWSQNHLETLLVSFSETGAQAAFTQSANFFDEAAVDLLGTELKDFERKLQPIELFENCPILTPSVMLKRALVMELGLFDESLRLCEDLDLWIRVVKQMGPFQDTRRTTFWRRIRPGSVSRDAAKVAEFTGRLYLKHADWEKIDSAKALRRASVNLAAAGRIYFWSTPHNAAPLYYKAWNARRLQLVNLGCFLLACMLMLVPSRIRSRFRRKSSR